ncbi:hypothetical protein C7974DRAFT_397960 [Boeremia exigua]|uniref:uncharacterized protein n=1 Tax=Boeremia exigua TaxID=749465 RepID=UPI001E8CBFDF|nr:uncharacterized protein C7974DRAFT_397960 [Boeremia exigua]KAH6622253.1 hypothetical protein C7974DRAFT_397960 [Boeremia exigua]
MEGASAEGLASEPPIPFQLRQKMLNRAATFADGVQPSPARSLRRRSSLLSDLSDTRHSTRSSTDNLLRNTEAQNKSASLEDGNQLISSPVIFAIFPAVGGLLYQNGAAVLTDLFTLGLASWFLHWCCTFPWTWYHLAQQRRYIEPDEPQFDDTIEEEDEDSVHDPGDDPALAADDTKARERVGATAAQLEASQALKLQERMAFAACFLGPLIGAYLLHTIRGQLKVTEGLVSDYNLTIFVMVAELRPIARLMKMQEERMFHLQRVVKTNSADLLDSDDAQALAQRLSELEGRLSGPTANNDLEISRVAVEVQQGLQKQLDAITRAIRRYEKRTTSQTMQIEARFQEVDLRLRDALTLAAAAARTGQRPGIVSSVISWIINVISNGLQGAWDIALYPLRTVIALTMEMKSYFVKDEERQSRKRVKGQSNGHSSVPTSRTQSKSTR